MRGKCTLKKKANLPWIQGIIYKVRIIAPLHSGIVRYWALMESTSVVSTPWKTVTTFEITSSFPNTSQG